VHEYEGSVIGGDIDDYIRMTVLTLTQGGACYHTRADNVDVALKTRYVP